jgi:hypothetical protein
MFRDHLWIRVLCYTWTTEQLSVLDRRFFSVEQLWFDETQWSEQEPDGVYGYCICHHKTQFRHAFEYSYNLKFYDVDYLAEHNVIDESRSTHQR